MIPKVIHYCWFGRNPLPEDARKCIASWRKYLPDYEIKEWNEDNFDVNIIPYTRQVYNVKKYAFLSDYARFWILYKYGGIYFDTDVELISPIDDIIEKGSFMSKEIDSYDFIAVNPGQGIAAVPNMLFYKRVLEVYANLEYIKPDGTFNSYSMIPIVTEMFLEGGLKVGAEIQKVEGINIYPVDYFNPWDDVLGKLTKTENTRAIHWYSKSWREQESGLKIWLKRLIRRIFGRNIGAKLKCIFK